MIFNTFLSRCFGTSKHHPTHLQGIQPVPLPTDYLWRQLYDDTTLEQAFQWLCEQTDAPAADDVWSYRRDWATRRPVLRERLAQGAYQFQPVRLIQVRTAEGSTEQREIRPAEDRLVIRALAQVLKPVLGEHLSADCTHLAGHGGLPRAVREVQEYVSEHPQSQVIKSDVQGYYAHIDHALLADQLRHLLPGERWLHNLLWSFMRRTTECGGDYQEVEKGIPLGASLSPLLGALYLAPLDDLVGQCGGFYRRYMDGWAWVLPSRRSLRKALKAQYAVLQALGVWAHPDKTFIGKVAKGFDFLGFHCCPTGMRVSGAALSRRDQKIARLYEQGASPRRIGRYLARWLGWVVMVGAAGGAWATPCVYTRQFAGSSIEIGIASNSCTCHGPPGGVRVSMYYRDVSFRGSMDSRNICVNANGRSDFTQPESRFHHGSTNACLKTVPQDFAERALRPNFEYIFQNTTEENDYYSCTTDEDGFFVSGRVGLCDINGEITDQCPVEISVTVNTPNGSISDNMSSPQISDCTNSGGTCTDSYDHGTTVILSATPDTGYSTIWSGTDAGSCSGDTCTFSSLDGARAVTASFSLNTYPVNVTVDTPNGSVSADAGDISGCTNSGGTCTDSYDHGTTVTLSATPVADHVTIWSGADADACSTNICTFNELSAAKSVTASFLPVQLFRDGFENNP